MEAEGSGAASELAQAVAGVEDAPAVASLLKEISELRAKAAALLQQAEQVEAEAVAAAAVARLEHMPNTRAAPRTSSAPGSRQPSGKADAASHAEDSAAATGGALAWCSETQTASWLGAASSAPAAAALQGPHASCATPRTSCATPSTTPSRCAAPSPKPGVAL